MTGTTTGAGTGRVVIQAAMSLDGFIAGPQHDMDWVFEYASPDNFPEIVQATGAMLSGRNCYEVGLRDTGKPSGEAYGGAWHGPSFVLTHRPPADAGAAGVPPADAGNSGVRPADAGAAGVTFLSGDIGAAVATAKEAAGEKDLVILGANVAGQCLARGLIDEILVFVLPVLLGRGTPLYTGGAARRVNLDPRSSTHSGSVTALRFQVVR
jgi:dihydrofolate reductase